MWKSMTITHNHEQVDALELYESLLRSTCDGFAHFKSKRAKSSIACMAFLCGDEFRWKVKSFDRCLLASIDFHGSVQTLTRVAARRLVDDATRLMQWICDFSGFKFVYDPSKTKILIKPEQLRRVMMRVVHENTRIGARDSCFDDNGFVSIETDPIGLNHAYSSKGCIHGAANYVSTSMHSVEGSIFKCNTSSVPGQVLLLLLSLSDTPSHGHGHTVRICDSQPAVRVVGCNCDQRQ